VDNLFVMLVVLQAFQVPEEQRHRVLFWGVLGALVMRGIFIALGTALVTLFHPVLYVFGAVLVVTGVRLAMPQKGATKSPTEGWLVRMVRRVVPVSSAPSNGAFFVKEHGRTAVTTLFLALVAVEGADLVFAVDSIPAVFAVTQDPFIVFSSNVLALLGLRSLFFALAGAVERFHLLRYGLAAVLLFVGGKMLLVDLVKVPVGLSLGIIAALLTVSVVASLARPPPVVEEPHG
jgi:tellurite resistance protein TerC